MSRPNCFVGVRLAGDALVECTSAIQNMILAENPSLRRLMEGTNKLHCTLFVCKITEDEIALAKAAMSECEGVIRGLFGSSEAISDQPLSLEQVLRFKGVSSFGKKKSKPSVIWLEPILEQPAIHAIQQSYRVLHDKFSERIGPHIWVNGNEEPIIHVTVAKNKGRGNELNASSLAIAASWPGWELVDSGRESLSGIIADVSLLRIAQVDPATNYYPALSVIPIAHSSFVSAPSSAVGTEDV